MTDQPGVSVIMPVRNEERHLCAAVARVLAQEYAGELEVVLAVGPSDDNTDAIASELAREDPRVHVVPNPSGFTPSGLNLAVAAARHDILLRVDGHAELSEGYVATAVALLEETDAANVGGLMDAQGQTPFEEAVAAGYNSRFGLGGGGFHLADTPAGPADTVFLGTFRRAALEAVGGFDESLHRGQDWELNYRLRQAGYLVYFSPKLKVTYRPRSTVIALAKQFYGTGRWRRNLVNRYPESLNFRYLAPPVVATAFALGAGLGAIGWASRKPKLAAISIIPISYLLGCCGVAALASQLQPKARLWFPVVLAVMHLSWGFGFLRGRDD